MPTLGMMQATFVQSLIRLCKSIDGNGGSWWIAFEIEQPVDRAREKLIERGIQTNADYLLFVDSDMEFTPGAFWKMLNKDVDFVSARAYTKTLPPLLCAWNMGEDGYYKRAPDSPNLTGLQKVRTTGLSFFLMRTSALKQVWKEHFKGVGKTEPLIKWQQYETGKGIGRTGEDIHFCEQLGKYGKYVWLDMDVEVLHYGTGISRDVLKLGSVGWYDANV